MCVIKNGFHWCGIDVMAYQVCAVGEREERKDLRNLLVFEYLAPGKLYLRPDLRTPRCAARRDVKNGVEIRQQETYQVVEVHQRDSQD